LPISNVKPFNPLSEPPPYNADTMKRYKKRFTVQKEDIDQNGHVGNIRYLEWFLEAAAEHSGKLGFGFEALKAMHRTWVAKEHRIAYKHSALEGDELELETWLESVKSVQGVRKYVLRNAADGRLVCEGETTWVFVESDTYRPKRIPEELMHAFE
jgi:acyl-CoA thioester hydrolase